MSFRYMIVEKQTREDCEKEINYHGAKGYRLYRIWVKDGLYHAIMEKFRREGGEN